jgi:glycosyltransferase involved in cell wall biosynthesis
VLLTPGVGLASIVLDNDLGYVAELNIDAIAQALDRHLSDPDRSKQLGINARQFAIENYNWNKIAGDLIRVYQSIIYGNLLT